MALERRALGRRVLIVGEADPEGCRRLLAAGARRIFVVGGGVEAGPGIEIHPPAPSLPLRDRSVDLVLLRSSIAEVVAGEVGPRIAEAARVLRAGGLLAVASDDGGEEGRRLLEGALRSSFAALRWLSLAPWRGLTIAPLGGAPRRAVLADELGAGPPTSREVLVLAAAEAIDDDECVLVALPEADAAEISGDDPRTRALALSIARREAEIAALERTLSERQGSIEQAKLDLEAEGERLQRARADVEAATAAREAALVERESALGGREEALVRVEGAVEERSAALDGARDEIRSREEALTSEASELRGREEAISGREATLAVEDERLRGLDAELLLRAEALAAR
ncbi:MAG: methyltransferase domain-containing protein, partial [Myxococcales bacterium]|nr:methyltransferase domain-containing protein [Myxococcales bacterium]